MMKMACVCESIHSRQSPRGSRDLESRPYDSKSQGFSKALAKPKWLINANAKNEIA